MWMGGQKAFRFLVLSVEFLVLSGNGVICAAGVPCKLYIVAVMAARILRAHAKTHRAYVRILVTVVGPGVCLGTGAV